MAAQADQDSEGRRREPEGSAVTMEEDQSGPASLCSRDGGMEEGVILLPLGSRVCAVEEGMLEWGPEREMGLMHEREVGRHSWRKKTASNLGRRVLTYGYSFKTYMPLIHLEHIYRDLLCARPSARCRGN